MCEILPRDTAVAHFLDDGREGVPLEGGQERTERASVFGPDLGQWEGKARQVVEAGRARQVVGDEELGNAGVLDDLDPIFSQVALEPGPCDVTPLVQPAGVLDLPGRAFARVLTA